MSGRADAISSQADSHQIVEHHGRVGATFGRLAGEYDGLRRKLLPCFDSFYRTVLDAIPFSPDQPFTFVDLGAGTGLLTEMVLAAFPKAHAVLIDLAPDMLVLAEQRLQGMRDRFSIRVADYTRVELPAGCGVVGSAMSIHFVSDQDKRRLYRNAWEALMPGGVFIDADQIRAPSPALQDFYLAMWDRLARECGATDAELDPAKERLALDRAATVADQLRWLEEAGFIDADCLFKEYLLAVLYARKPA